VIVPIDVGSLFSEAFEVSLLDAARSRRDTELTRSRVASVDGSAGFDGEAGEPLLVRERGAGASIWPVSDCTGHTKAARYG